MISLIIPTIGRNDTIEEAINSAMACSGEWVSEIILADNSQDADFADRLNGIAVLDGRIRIISYPERLDMARSWNTATHESREDWVLYLHDDDVLYPEAVGRAWGLTGADVGFVYCDYDEIRDNQPIGTKKYDINNKISAIIRDCPKFVSTLIRREAIMDCGQWDSNCGYGLDFCLFMLIAKKWRYVHGAFPLGAYRLYSGNLSAQSLRNKHYGDFLGHNIDILFQAYPGEEERRLILDGMINFVYPTPQESPKPSFKTGCRSFERRVRHALRGLFPGSD